MKIKLIVCAIALVIGAASCSSVRVTTRGAVPVTTSNGEDERVKTVGVFLGQSKKWDEDFCNGAPVAEVTVVPNFFYSLANVVTLGIWAPVKVMYKCNEECDN